MGNDDEQKRPFCQFFYELPCNNAIVSCQLRGRMKCGSCMRRPLSSVQSSSTRKFFHRLKIHWLTKTGHELCCMFSAPSCVYWLVLGFVRLGKGCLNLLEGYPPFEKGFYTSWKGLSTLLERLTYLLEPADIEPRKLQIWIFCLAVLDCRDDAE